MSASKVVLLQGNPLVLEEFAASAAITPGMFLDIDSGELRPSAVTTAVARVVALEREELGDDFDVAYASGDQVKAAWCGPETLINALIPSGQNLLAGALLECNAAGLLVAVSSGIPIAMSMEDSGAVLVQTRHRVAIV